VVDAAWAADGGVASRFARDLPADREPAGGPLVMEPRLVELCLQTAGVDELVRAGRLALPQRIGRVSTLAHPAPGAELFARVRRADGDGGGVDAEVVDGAGRVHVVVRGYRTVELPGAPEADRLAPLRRALSAS
jgi:hypothetical protein